MSLEAVEPPKTQKFLSITEVREVLGISNSFFYQLLRRGDLCAYKLGGRTVVKEADLVKMTSNLRRA